MKSTTDLSVIQDNFQLNDELNDLFAELDRLDPFEIKKEELAAQLAALLSYAGETRSEFASKSGWKKSRVSNILNGRGNPTFKTLWEYAQYLGYEADLHFRRPTEAPANQPWNSRKLEVEYTSESSERRLYLFNIQTATEVAKDMIEGNHKDHYISITTLTYPDSLSQSKQLTDSHFWNPILTINFPKSKNETKELICQKTS